MTDRAALLADLADHEQLLEDVVTWQWVPSANSAEYVRVLVAQVEQLRREAEVAE